MAFKEYPVRVGSMLFTQVDPARGKEVEYNRWYERDHFYAGCMIGPWLFAGRRWVATRDLKDLRFPSDTPVLPAVDAGSYVAVYWLLDGKYDEHVEWATDQVNWLYAQRPRLPGPHARAHRHVLRRARAGTATTTRCRSSWRSTTSSTSGWSRSSSSATTT